MLIEESLKMVENGVGKVLYKIELLLIKVIPFIIMFCYALNSILYYFDIEVIFLSTFSGLSILTWIFLYISSFVFKFCIYHRLPLYYILTIDIINYYDYLIGLPISDKRLFILDIIIIGIFLLFIVYFKFKQHEQRTS